MHAMTDIDTPNLVIWPKWCYSNNLMESEAQDLVLNNNNNNSNNNNNLHLKDKPHSGLCASSRNRKKPRSKELSNGIKEFGTVTSGTTGVNGMPADPAGDVKAERLSPDPATEIPGLRRVSPTPSTSPKSPASHRTRTPSYSGNSPNPAFTPPSSALHSPYDRFSPASLGAMSGLPGGHGAIKHMENLMTRNCSDLMRSLAAKYNNSNPNDYFSNPNNGFLRSPLQNIPTFKGGPTPFLGVPPHGVVSSVRDSEKKLDPPVSSSISQSLSSPGGPPLFTNPGGIPGFPGFPLVDMSSTQVLLNMVRNASAAQQSQLENYLRGAMKRPADTPSCPLDLSSSVAAKRPRTEVSRSFDVKNLFSIVSEEDKKAEEKVPSPPSPPVTKPRQLSSPGYKSIANIPCNDKHCPTLEGVLHWTVEDVCAFVGSIDLCAEYVEAFREQRIDGATLPLLTEEHLTTSINMKLGPALKLKSVLARKLGACNICLHCNHCHSIPVDRRPNSASSGQ